VLQFSSFLHSGSFGDGRIPLLRARSTYFKMTKIEMRSPRIMVFPNATCWNPTLFPIRLPQGRLSLPRHTVVLVRCLLLRQMSCARKHPRHRRKRPAKAPHSHNYHPSILFSMTTPVPARIYQAKLCLRRSNFPLHTRISANLSAPSLVAEDES
jgi:hypothetical protein